jgi:hypothetical protein
MGPRAGLDAADKRIILVLPTVEPRPSNPLPIAIPTEVSRLSVTFVVSVCTTGMFKILILTLHLQGLNGRKDNWYIDSCYLTTFYQPQNTKICEYLISI